MKECKKAAIDAAVKFAEASYDAAIAKRRAKMAMEHAIACAITDLEMGVDPDRPDPVAITDLEMGVDPDRPDPVAAPGFDAE